MPQVLRPNIKTSPELSKSNSEFFWDRGIQNLADYFSKHHSGAHHRQVRPIFLHTKQSPDSLQGCIKLLGMRAPKLRDLIRLTGVHKQVAAA